MKKLLVFNLPKILFLSILPVFLGLSFGVFFGFNADNAQADEEQKTGTGDFVVGMECNYQPFDWQTSKPTKTSISIGSAGYCDGYDVIVARKIANQIGKNLSVKKISWEGLQPALESGVIDTIISGVTATPERQKGMDFTTSYYSSEMVMLVRKDSPESKFNSIKQFSGLTVISQKNTTYDEVIDQIKGVKHGVPKDTFSVLVYALQNNQTNGVTCELPVAQGIVRSNSNLGIVKFSEGQGFLADTNVSIAFAKGAAQTPLFQSVQNALNKITLQDKEKYMQEAVDSHSAYESESDEPSGFFATVVWIFQNNWYLFFTGTQITILLAILGTFFGFLIGLGLGLSEAAGIKAHNKPFTKLLKTIFNLLVKLYVFIFRGTPMMIQAIFIFYVLRPIFQWEPLTAAIIIISVNTGAYMSEIIRSGVQSVDIGQREAAQSLGMTHSQQLLYIILPQAIRNSFPSIGNQFVVNIKDSCVLNVIGVIDLYFQSSSVSGSMMLFAQTFFITCIIYLILTFLAQLILNVIEKKISLDGKAGKFLDYNA